MRKKYVTPTMFGERFSADEYVAACITGTIQCVYPGTAWEKGDNGVYGDYNHQESGVYIDEYGKKHGICGDDATISFNGTTASGYEFVNGKAVTGRPISNITGYREAKGTYNVTWTSVDNVNNTGTYYHKGKLVVSNIDNNHPNHS